MKHELKISTLSIVCALCTAVPAAYGASSVRTLGGAGTYNSASSAASAKSSGSAAIAAARGGSVRVTPSSTRTGTAVNKTAGATSGRVATTPRLSIGKYLGGGTSVSGGSSIRPQSPSSGAAGSDALPGLQTDVTQLADDVAQLKTTDATLTADVEKLKDADVALSDDIAVLKSGKQDLLYPTTTGYISIEKNASGESEIFVNVEDLKSAMGAGREVEFQKNTAGDAIQWRYVTGDDTAWRDLFTFAEITDGYATDADITALDDKIAQAAQNVAATYATKNDIANMLTTTVAAETYATQAYVDGLTFASDITKINETLATKADASVVKQLQETTATNAAATVAVAEDLEAYKASNNAAVQQNAANIAENAADIMTKADAETVAADIATAKAELTKLINDGGTATDANVTALAERVTTAEGKIVTNTNAIGSINTEMDTYGDIVTHNVSEFATSAQGDKADTALQKSALAPYSTTAQMNTAIAAATKDMLTTTAAAETYATQTTVGDLAETVGTKADAVDLTALTGRVDGISDITSKLVDDVADAATVADKAQVSVDALAKNVADNYVTTTTANNTYATQTAVNNLTTTVESKADKATVTEVTNLVNQKVDKTEVQQYIANTTDLKDDNIAADAAISATKLAGVTPEMIASGQPYVMMILGDETQWVPIDVTPAE